MEPLIRCSELLESLSDDEVLIIDCRGEEDWLLNEQHIPGALRMTVDEVADAAAALPEDELIVVVGAAEDGSDMRRACRLLRMRGRLAVCLQGGMQAWLRHGFPTESHERRRAAARSSTPSRTGAPPHEAST